MFEDIVRKITSKGWNLYDAGARMEEDLLRIVPHGNVNSLENDRHYLVLPRVADSRSLFEIQRAIETMALTREFPLLRYKQLTITLPAFRIQDRGVTVYSQKELFFSYEEFRSSLDTLVDRTSN